MIARGVDGDDRVEEDDEGVKQGEDLCRRGRPRGRIRSCMKSLTVDTEPIKNSFAGFAVLVRAGSE